MPRTRCAWSVRPSASRSRTCAKSELLVTLEAFLLSQTSQGKRCLLIVDEAQNLTPRAVEELRMLSNFQYGNQALLQTFLVGQPEFREILQRPEMEQFRQRVAATCHIGPLDADETTAYIEHRLKCAGSTDKPTFEPEAFEAIHKASDGIPRRINAICDRLLLLGFLCDRIASDRRRRGRGRSRVRRGSRRCPTDAGSPRTIAATRRPADLAVELEPRSRPVHAAGPGAWRKGLSAADSTRSAPIRHIDQLQRLERSVLRLERVNVQTLGMLKKLVNAVTEASRR